MRQKKRRYITIDMARGESTAADIVSENSNYIDDAGTEGLMSQSTLEERAWRDRMVGNHNTVVSLAGTGGDLPQTTPPMSSTKVIKILKNLNATDRQGAAKLLSKVS